MDKDKKQEEREKFFKVIGEDATKYGEFVSSYFAWIPLGKQKEKAEELENITKKTDNKKGKINKKEENKEVKNKQN